MVSLEISLRYSFRPHCGAGVNSASNRSEYQEYFLGGKVGRWVGLTTLPNSYADCLEISEPQVPRIPRVCPEIALPLCRYNNGEQNPFSSCINPAAPALFL